MTLGWVIVYTTTVGLDCVVVHVTHVLRIYCSLMRLGLRLGVLGCCCCCHILLIGDVEGLQEVIEEFPVLQVAVLLLTSIRCHSFL